MSDTWYKPADPLPPYEDWEGRLWTLDGVCLNPAEILSFEDLIGAALDEALRMSLAHIDSLFGVREPLSAREFKDMCMNVWPDMDSDQRS